MRVRLTEYLYFVGAVERLDDFERFVSFGDTSCV